MSYAKSPIGRAVERLRLRDRIENQSIAVMTGALQVILTNDWRVAEGSDDEIVEHNPLIAIEMLTEAIIERNESAILTYTDVLADIAFRALRTGDFEPRTRKGEEYAKLINTIIEARLDAVDRELTVNQ